MTQQPIQLQNNTDLSSYQTFIYALRSSESKRQYPRRLQIFLNYLNIDSSMTIDEKSNLFYSMIGENSSNWLEYELLKFFTLQNQRAERKEISTEPIKNYLKHVKLFCEMNGVIINWKIISKGIKRGNRYYNDRPPTREEINKLLEYL